MIKSVLNKTFISLGIFLILFGVIRAGVIRKKGEIVNKKISNQFGENSEKELIFQNKVPTITYYPGLVITPTLTLCQLRL